MAKRPKHGNNPRYALQSDLDALSERVNKLEQAVSDLISHAIQDDETVTIKKTCHIANVKVVSVSSKMAKPGASALKRLKKMGN